MIAKDTVALIKSGYKKITVYQHDQKDGPRADVIYEDTLLIGTWTIFTDGGNLIFEWHGKFSNLNHVTSRKLKSNLIKEAIGEGDQKFKLSHYFRDDGFIKNTKNTTKSKFETRYHFEEIWYTYNKEGLLTSADYLENCKCNHPMYSRYRFTYEK